VDGKRDNYSLHLNNSQYMCNRVAVQWVLLCKARPWIHQLQISNTLQVTVPLVIIAAGAVYNASYEITKENYKYFLPLLAST
jgi:hypothetical protein